MSRAHFPGPQRQHGIGMVTVFVMLAIGIFLGIFAIKVVPQYIENWTVQSIVQDAVNDPDLLKQTKGRIYTHLNKAYRQNNLWDLKAEDSITLEKLGRDKGYKLLVKYERRANFIHNIYLVTAFEETPEIEAAP
ncbi:MAG: hypothetical protein ACI9XK_004161 [Granulosicoccus sp.]|jgi:hypothetical protein